MTSLRTLSHALALAAITGLAAALTASVPVAASCLPVQVPAADAVDTVVVVGTVRGIEGSRTELDVDAWFLGEGPTDTVVVVGGRDPGVITSVDWTPAAGEQYVVVAAPTISRELETEPCQQQRATPELLSTLLATYGDPWSPPLASPMPSQSPTASDDSEPLASLHPASADASPEAS